jgi:arsenate reductase-like glutaredoxin family protein
MKSKYTRYDLIGAINQFCINNGLSYFTYIEKKTKAELEAIVAQYNINVDEMRAEQAKKEEERLNFIPNLQATIKKNIDFLLDKIQMLESLLTAEQHEKYIEYCNSQNSN